MATQGIPKNLMNLHHGEEQLRTKSLELVAADFRLSLHLNVVERAMDLADILRQFDTNDENLKVIQILGMRVFNAFGSSIKLALSGYAQNSALILRDILETVFILDYFNGDREAIKQWRFADEREIKRRFKPVDIRMALDRRDGHTDMKRYEIYKLFSELAGHPTMKSAYMMRPQKDGDAVIGPFIEKTTVDAVLSEMGKLAVQAGEILDAFFPEDWTTPLPAREAFTEKKREWITTFYNQHEKSKA